ncbi:hypothetical protein D3C71_2202350 [compost metagenome]
MSKQLFDNFIGFGRYNKGCQLHMPHMDKVYDFAGCKNGEQRIEGGIPVFRKHNESQDDKAV